MSKLLDMVKQLVAAAGVTTSFETDIEFHLQLEQPTFAPLVIEAWPASQQYFDEKRHISVAHYYDQDDDILVDPDVLMTDQGYPIALTQPTGYTRVLVGGSFGNTLVNEQTRQDVVDFMDIWAQQIRDQGWLLVAIRINQDALDKAEKRYVEEGMTEAPDVLAWNHEHEIPMEVSLTTVFHVFTHGKDHWLDEYRLANKWYRHYKKAYGCARLYKEIYEDEEDLPLKEDCLLSFGDFPL